MIGIYRGLIIVLLGIFAQSCATTTGEPQTTNGTPDVAGAVEEQFVATEGLTPRERFSQALRMLENGEVGQANAELQAYVATVAKSRSANARALLKQISTPIEEYFPADYFTVSLGDGESLSTLAKTYLGDALKFYALARYNSISAPSRVFVGQEVRIPLTESARQARDDAVKDTQMTEDSTSTEAPVEESLEEPAAIETPPTERKVTIGELIAAENYSGAVDYANSAPEGSLDNGTLIIIYKGYAEQSKADNPYIAADAYHHLSVLYEQANDMESALGALENALTANADHTQAAESLNSLKPRLVANYYRSASAAFRRQDLDTTIEYSDKVLALEPDHANARLYKAQALELQKRLEKLNAGNK